MLILRPSTLLLFGYLLVQYSCRFQLAEPSSNFTDQSALLAFKSKIQFTDTILAGNWSTKSNFCDWIGVSCSRRRQRVTALDLSYMGLQGTISPHIGNLSFLLSLDLRNNSFYGFLPQEISRLHRLRKLDLTSNQLEGSIPPTIHNCQKLVYFSLAANKLNGTIPLSFSNISTLELLNLQYNSLTGPFPVDILNISSLTAVALTENHVSGTLPTDLCNHCPNLQGLYFSENEFSGQLPSKMYKCRELVYLSLSYNMFDGIIPEGFGSLEKLQVLILGGNNLTGSIPHTIANLSTLKMFSMEHNSIEGRIPSSLGNISTLEFLSLESNSLTGPFPLVILNISSLTTIALTENHISGTLPMDLCNHCPNLQELYFSKNEFSGKLPSKMYKCRELFHLALSSNRFEGSIPEGYGSLEKLQVLDLGGNNLTGNIPHTVANLSMLKKFYIQKNYIRGSIPSDLGRLFNLNILSFGGNYLTGAIPQQIFNISSLQLISLTENSLSGILPLDTGLSRSNLQRLHLASNEISGHIPSYLSNFSRLVDIDFSHNLLFGPVPKSLGNLKYLKRLLLLVNKLTGEPGDPELSFLSSLSNCRFLEMLYIFSNPFNCMIPDSIGNFSSSLKIFGATESQLKGHIPPSLGSLKNLNFLDLSSNNLTGNIPSTFGGLERLQILYLGSNNIAGFIPKELCHLWNLGELSLEYNAIIGSIPDCIGNLSSLQKLYLDYNRLTSSIPVNLWGLENLLYLDLSFNTLRGYLPQNMRKSIVIQSIDLSTNQFAGNLPSIIGTFESLNSLNLSSNSFEGSIPESFDGLKGLDFLDLSYNNLSGAIPKSLEALSLLKYVNFSFNKLSGEIPSGGPFTNFTAKSFLDNKALCGLPIFGVPSCTSPGSRGSRVKQLLLRYVLPAISSIIIFVALVYMLRKHRKRNMHIPSSVDQTLAAVEHRMISYQELCQATNDFCESNLLGTGSFGSVYRGTLSDGTNVAIKVLDLQLEGASKSFDAECKVLRTIRHRNLVKVISSCSNPELRALVLQYMSNGSLEKWLYSHNYCLNLLQRVSILVDVALAVEYLHHGQSEPVVHCDLKPSNILLDQDMVAHVADFGIAKILVENKEATQTKTLGTPGYIAPEYGSDGKVSAKGDVYSYGIMLLEMITRKKPTDEMFTGELTLRQWINASFPSKIMEIMDNGLLRIEDGRDVIAMQSTLSSIMELGLRCSEELPDERIDIKDVVIKLNKIKLSLHRNRNRDA